MIEGMSTTMAKKVLETLLAEGRLDQDEVLRAIALSPSPEMQRMVDILHGLLCTVEHADPGDVTKDTDENLCYYNVEETITSTWVLPFHKKWLRISLNVMRQLDVAGEEGMKKVVKQVKEVGKLHKAAIRLYLTADPLEPVDITPLDAEDD